jgi:hypothetical protein
MICGDFGGTPDFGNVLWISSAIKLANTTPTDYTYSCSIPVNSSTSYHLVIDCSTNVSNHTSLLTGVLNYGTNTTFSLPEGYRVSTTEGGSWSAAIAAAMALDISIRSPSLIVTSGIHAQGDIFVDNILTVRESASIKDQLVVGSGISMGAFTAYAPGSIYPNIESTGALRGSWAGVFSNPTSAAGANGLLVTTANTGSATTAFAVTSNNGTTNTSLLNVGANGIVGIGTLTAVSKLEVAGNVSIGSAGIGAPTNGLYVVGQGGFGTSSPFTSSRLDVSHTASTILAVSTSDTSALGYAGIVFRGNTAAGAPQPGGFIGFRNHTGTNKAIYVGPVAVTSGIDDAGAKFAFAHNTSGTLNRFSVGNLFTSANISWFENGPTTSTLALVSGYQIAATPTTNSIDFSISGVELLELKGQSLTVSTDILTTVSGTYDLGSVTLPFAELYVNDIFSASQDHYVSRTITSSNTNQTGIYIPFNHSSVGGTSANVVTPKGITFNDANGRFTVSKAGKYMINLNVSVSGSGSGTYSVFRIRVGGTSIWDGTIKGVSGDGFASTSIIANLAASDIVDFQLDSNSTNNSSCDPGTTFTMYRIGN